MIYYAADIDAHVWKYDRLWDRPPKYGLFSLSKVITSMRGTGIQGVHIRTGDSLKNSVERILKRIPDQTKLIADSGCYGLLVACGVVEYEGAASHKKYSLGKIAAMNARSIWASNRENLDIYVQTYLTEVVPLLWDRVDLFVEPDFHWFVPDDQIQRWRDQIYELGYSSKFMLVDHGLFVEDGCVEDYLYRMLVHSWNFVDLMKKWPSKSCSIPGWEIGFYPELEAPAKALENVHGFGVSSVADYFAFPYASVDSTRWISPAVWGRLEVWNPIKRKMDIYPTSPQSQGWKEFVAKHGKSPMEMLGLPKGSDKESVGVLMVEQVKQIELMSRDVTSYWERIRRNGGQG